MYQSIQGNLGFGKALEYFTSHNITVAIPLNDTQKYDLVADFDGKLQRISVKTSRFTRNGTVYEVMLKNCGGTSKGSKIRAFDNTTCDYIFIVTGNDKIYLIPADVITATNSINVGNKYTEYEVFPLKLSEFTNEEE